MRTRPPAACCWKCLREKAVARGLSMPHSPRWHADRLWVLESGAGSLSVVDESTGRLTHVALLPGFTRGLDFVGPYAFVGLSQVRETAVFSGIPITERLPVEERACGMWVVDVRTGQTVAFLRFESGVQEVFAVQVLPNIRYPEILTEEADAEGRFWPIRSCCRMRRWATCSRCGCQTKRKRTTEAQN